MKLLGRQRQGGLPRRRADLALVGGAGACPGRLLAGAGAGAGGASAATLGGGDWARRGRQGGLAQPRSSRHPIQAHKVLDLGGNKGPVGGGGPGPGPGPRSHRRRARARARASGPGRAVPRPAAATAERHVALGRGEGRRLRRPPVGGGERSVEGSPRRFGRGRRVPLHGEGRAHRAGRRWLQSRMPPAKPPRSAAAGGHRRGARGAARCRACSVLWRECRSAAFSLELSWRGRVPARPVFQRRVMRLGVSFFFFFLWRVPPRGHCWGVSCLPPTALLLFL